MDANMLGAYGEWAAGLRGGELPRLSFRREEFKSVAAWRRKALARVTELLAVPDTGGRPRARVLHPIWEWDGVGILVDVLPFIGNFIEIEGPEERIVETAGKLGLEMKDAITKDYGQMFRAYMEEKGMTERDMTFEEGK